VKVTIFTRSTCAPCKNIKYWLNKKGITFDEKDVDENQEEFLRSGGGLMVPFILVNDIPVQGANIPLLSKLLML